jgi:trk system potassium uptake protein TrkA
MNVLIIGAGEVGFHLTKELSAEKHNITIVESDAQRAKRADEQLDAMVVHGSGASFKDLKRAKIEQTNFFAALSNKDEINLLACRYAKKLEIPHKIARVRSPEYIAPDYIFSLEEMGVDLLIHPEKETADAIVRLIRQSSATDVVEFAGGTIQLLGIRVEKDSPIRRRPLKDVWQEYGNVPARIVAIIRANRTIIPSGDDYLLAGDQAFIVCDKEHIPDAITIMGKENVSIRRIMILGGGLIGQLVARELEAHISRARLSSTGMEPMWISWRLKGSSTWTPSLPLQGMMRRTSSRR